MTNDEQLSIALRPWTNEDLPLLQRMMRDPEMTAHLGGPVPQDSILERHERYCQRMSESGRVMFVIAVLPERVAAGAVGYWEREWRGEKVWETGWMVLPDFQGRGAATQATAEVLKRARAENMHRFVHAFPDVDNVASNAICRKLGFTNLGEVEFENVLHGTTMRSNDWRLDLFADGER